jgi:predicted enzyme related to lactoylglutathione lyase
MKNAEIHGALMQKKIEQISTQFATVESIDDYIDNAQQLGAKVIKNKQEISERYFTVSGDPKNTSREWQINNINNKSSSIIFSFSILFFC